MVRVEPFGLIVTRLASHGHRQESRILRWPRPAGKPDGSDRFKAGISAADRVPSLPYIELAVEFAVMEIIGRAALLETLTAHAVAGHAVLVHGPRGIGASAVLDACEGRLRAAGRRSVRVMRLARHADLMGPLSRAYTDAADTPKPLLRPHIERDPAVLLVDRVERSGPMVRREVRELGAIGVGAILAGQADTPREHAYLRSLRLAHREIAIPPLDGDAMQRILDANLAPAIAAQLTKADRARTLRVAAGRPGVLVALLRMLAQPRYWRAGRPALDLAASDLAILDGMHSPYRGIGR